MTALPQTVVLLPLIRDRGMKSLGLSTVDRLSSQTMCLRVIGKEKVDISLGIYWHFECDR